MLYLDYGRKAGEWIPNQFGGHENLDAVLFVKDLNVLVHRDFPGAMMLAEESTSWAGVSRPTYTGGLGFTFKWNMGWMRRTGLFQSRSSASDLSSKPVNVRIAVCLQRKLHAPAFA